MFGKRIAMLLFSIFLFSTSVQAAVDLPLSVPGPYAVGLTRMRFQDVQRDRMVINTSIWYPALAGADGSAIDPDRSGAPYPLVLYSHGLGSSPAEAVDTGLVQALVSHGFVVAAMRHSTDLSPNSFVDRPLDVLFTLNSLAALDEGELVGMIDTDRVGVTGWSSGGYSAMVAAGARLNPRAIQALLASPFNPGDVTDIRYAFPDWNWDAFAEYGARFLSLDGDNLWPAITDDRIRAVLPIAEADAPLFGEAGIAAISKPVFIVAGTADQYNPYPVNVVPAFEDMGAMDHYLLTLIGESHFFPIDPHMQPTLVHFAVAYFGYYLQDKVEYASYLSAEYVSSLTNSDKLVWGVYSGE
jgi:predicted dienelactone hydrolase